MTHSLSGWVEIRGRILSPEEAIARFRINPTAASEFGGEFFIRCEECSARDALGIVPGDIPQGKIVCGDNILGSIDPVTESIDLNDAIIESVRLRSNQGIVAVSGGIDSTLIAALAGLPCISVGIQGSPDLGNAERAARSLNLDWTFALIQPDEIEDVVKKVIDTIPQITPMDVAIATTQYFITRAACEEGHSRVLSGQGADELFGGYSRYATAEDIESELARDFLSLRGQADRDQSVAALHGVLLSMPYLDLRVVRAAQSIPASGKVRGPLRKIALREVAERYIPPGLAWAEKKAMQYGTGVWKEIRHLAKRRGFSDVTGYLSALAGET